MSYNEFYKTYPKLEIFALAPFVPQTAVSDGPCNDRFHDLQLCYVVQAPPFQILPIPQFQWFDDSAVITRLHDCYVIQWFHDCLIPLCMTLIPLIVRLLHRAIPPMVFVQTGNMIPFNVCWTNIEHVSLWNIKCYFLINSMKTYSMFVLQTG